MSSALWLGAGSRSLLLTRAAATIQLSLTRGLVYTRQVAPSFGNPSHYLSSSTSILKNKSFSQIQCSPCICHDLQTTIQSAGAQRGSLHASFQKATFSTTSSDDGSGDSSFASRFSPLNWWKNRQEKKQQDKFLKQIENMCNADAWRIGDMQAELEEVANSWASKIPGGATKEIQAAKDMSKCVNALVSVVGKDATGERLEAMTRTEKLKVAVAAETTVEELNIMIQQFLTMTVMQKVLRKRKLEGKKIPDSVEGITAIVQKEGMKMMTDSQKDSLKKTQARSWKRAMRKR